MVGQFVFRVFMRNDSYKGLDKNEFVTVNILPAPEKKKFQYHAEDVELAKKVLFFDQVLNEQANSEDEIEDEVPVTK